MVPVIIPVPDGVLLGWVRLEILGCYAVENLTKLGKKDRKLVSLAVPAGFYLVKNCLDIRIAAV
jgi:hypothetical protein